MVQAIPPKIIVQSTARFPGDARLRLGKKLQWYFKVSKPTIQMTFHLIEGDVSENWCPASLYSCGVAPDSLTHSGSNHLRPRTGPQHKSPLWASMSLNRRPKAARRRTAGVWVGLFDEKLSEVNLVLRLWVNDIERPLCPCGAICKTRTNLYNLPTWTILASKMNRAAGAASRYWSPDLTMVMGRTR